MKKNQTTVVSGKAQLYQKIARMMKLTAAFLLLACLQVSAKGWGQERITLKMNEAEIKKVLFAIEKRTDYRFLFTEDAVKGKPRVTVDVKEATLPEVLDRILANTGIAYKLLNTNLVVLKETPAAEEIILQDVRITGRITSANGEPLAGVSISVKGSRLGTTTDANGNFSITVPDDAVLVISSVGYDSQEVSVKGQTTVNVSLRQSEKVQDAVVVIGYGSASKRDLTGSIVKISGSEVADKPNSNPISSLQSKVAGLSIVNNGEPGSQPDIRIRGTVSIGSVNPLYVVDGIFTDNIDYLSPNNIESIEVLKDPSSLAIFGVKGASGVIAITTKRAKAGQVNVTLSTNIGTKKMVDKIELASGDDFRKIFAMEAANGLNDPDPTIGNKNTDFLNNEMSKWTGNTDWVDAVTRTAVTANSNLTITAANDRNKFVMGLGFNLDQGLVKHTEYKRYSLNMSDEYKLNKFIKIGFNVVGSSENLPYNSSALFDARKALPIIPSDTKRFRLRNPYLTVFDSADYDVYASPPVIQNTERNPLHVLENNYDKLISNRLRAVGSAWVDVSFLRDFNFKATFYGDFSSGERREYTPVYYAYNPAAISNQAYLYNTFSQVSQRNSTQKAIQEDFILNYKRTIGDHSVNAMVGNTWYKIKYSDIGAIAKQRDGDQPIPDDKRFWYATNGFAIPSSPSSNQWEYATVSVMGRLLYNYRNKYFFTGSYRKDYASNINDVYEKKGQNFWAIGLGWEITREDFMKNQNLFDYLKLKGSIGVLGNFNTGTIGGYYPFYPGVNATQAVFGVGTATVFENRYLPDPNLHWETVHAKEIGVEFNMLDNRLHGDINYYNKRTKDLLTTQKIGGVLPTLKNAGEILNKGFEISASWNQQLNKDLSFTVGGNITTYDNEVVELKEPLGGDPQFPNATKTGQPIGYFIGYVVEGLYQTYADILASPVVKIAGPAVQPGDFKYKDISGPDGKPDGQIDDFDQTIIGNPTPDFTYGINLTVKYKSFDLGVDLAGVYGNEIYRYWSTSEQKNSVYNYPKYFLEAWNGPGTSNWVPIVDAQHLTNRVPSTYGIEDGSYFRIRNIGLGYNFKFTKAYIKNGRVYINIQNLKTWKRNLGYSPEYGGSATSFGIDAGGAGGALPRIFSAGFTVTF